MQKPATTDAPIHEIIRHRWSPRSFDARSVEPEKLRTLFEAARWAASSGKMQPWHFIVAAKGDAENFNRVLQTFKDSNQVWATTAAVIGLSVAALNLPQTTTPNRHAFYDVGQAVSALALQATDLGLQLHQMAGIFPDKAREIFGIPEGYEAVAGFALGYPGDPNSLPDKLREREVAPRARKPLAEFVYSGSWGSPASIAVSKS